MSEAERHAWNRVIGIGFVLVVGGSSALVAFANGASLAATAVVGLAGLLVGVVLAWYLSSLSMEPGARRRRP